MDAADAQVNVTVEVPTPVPVPTPVSNAHNLLLGWGLMLHSTVPAWYYCLAA